MNGTDVPLAQQLIGILAANREDAYRTHQMRGQILKSMARELHAKFGLQKWDNLKQKHVAYLVDQLKAEDKGSRTIDGKLSNLRWLCRKIGKANLMPKTNKELGIASHARHTHAGRVVTAEKLQQVLDALKDQPRLAAMVLLARALGLRFRDRRARDVAASRAAARLRPQDRPPRPARRRAAPRLGEAPEERLATTSFRCRPSCRLLSGGHVAYVFREYRSNGKPWCIAYTGVDGKLRREKTDAPTKELAKKLLAKRIVEVTEAKIAGVTVDRPVVTFTEFVKEYTRHIEAKKTVASIARDKEIIERLKKTFGDARMKDVTTGMVQRYMDDRMHDTYGKGHPYRPATINREIICLSAISREAVKRDHVVKNPVRGVKLLKEDNKIVRYLSDDEERRLMAACTPNLKPIVVFALNTGMRKGEILNLEWDDVDLEQRLIRVRNTKSKRTRYIPINTTLKTVLAGLAKYEGCPHVFTNPDTRTRWCDQKIAWRYTIRRAKVTKFRFHDLRHTFASRLVQAGVPLQAVQELLGHATIEMTMRYAHLAPDDLRKAVEIIVPRPAPQQPSETPPPGGP